MKGSGFCKTKKGSCPTECNTKTMKHRALLSPALTSIPPIHQAYLQPSAFPFFTSPGNKLGFPNFAQEILNVNQKNLYKMHRCTCRISTACRMATGAHASHHQAGKHRRNQAHTQLEYPKSPSLEKAACGQHDGVFNGRASHANTTSPKADD